MSKETVGLVVQGVLIVFQVALIIVLIMQNL